MKKFLLSMAVAMMAFGAAKAEEQVLFEGSEALSWGGIAIPSMTLTATSDVTMSITIETTTGDWWQFKFVNGEGWATLLNLLDKEFVNSNDVDYNWAAGTYTYNFDLNETQIAMLKEGVFAQGSITGGEILLKKVAVKDQIKYKDAVSLEFNEYGQIESSAFNGYSDDAKITFTWECTGAEGYKGWSAGSLKSFDETVDTGFGFKVSQEGTNEFSCTLADIEDALNAGPNTYGMYGITWGLWGFGDGACENTRVSVTIAEVEGFSGEGYVAPFVDAIDAIEVAADAEVINLFGQKANKAEGFMIKGGKKVLVK